MNLEPVFSEVLITSQRAWKERKVDECILSIAIPVEGIDPLEKLPLIAEKHQFRFLWDLSPGLCISAGGHCQSLDLSGSKKENEKRILDAEKSGLGEVSINRVKISSLNLWAFSNLFGPDKSKD
jgi:menaquinone-specific isochorismate synthase